MNNPYPSDLDGTFLKKSPLDEAPMRLVENIAYSGENVMAPHIAIDSVHGGDHIPAPYWHLFDRKPDRLEAYIREKDWGANQVAYELTQLLDLPGFHKVELARALLDYNRFPGVTSPRQPKAHLNRFCLNPPVSEELLPDEVRDILGNQYDAISKGYEEFTSKTTLKISIHTYDTHNPGANTKRPATSILYRSLDYQEQSQMPPGIFDPLFIDELAEFTADRRLVNRLGLTLEKANLAMAYNYPYLMPSGCIEVRAQVWSFFRYFREMFEADHPETKDNVYYKHVWNMLSDTNLRDGNSQMLRSYIHKFRHPPAGYEEFCHLGSQAYQHLSAYMDLHRKAIRRNYRYHPYRLSCIAIEVRKDLVWDFRNMMPRVDNVKRVAGLLAEGIQKYFKDDYAYREELLASGNRYEDE